MLSNSRSQVAGEADEQAGETDVTFQPSGEYSLGPEPTIYYEDFLPLPVSAGPYPPEIFLPRCAFKSEIDNSDWNSGFGMNTPNSLSPESDCPRNHTVPIILGNVANIDNIEPEHHFPVLDPTKRDETALLDVTPGTQSRKRSRTEISSTDQLETDLRAKQKAKTDKDSGEKARSQLACPFQKLDPHKHHECLKYALHRIKDVKQHVYRRHKQPEFYCARCFDIFKTANARDEHARSKDCDNLEGPEFEGISEIQKNRLNKSSSRGLDPQDQWFEMWDIIFPGKPRPSSAWVGSYMEEMVPLLRSLWKHKSSRILAKAQKGQTRPLDEVLLHDVVGSIFDCLEDEASASLGKRAPGSCPQIQHGLMDGQLPVSTPPSTFITDSPHSFFAEPHDLFPNFNIKQEEEHQNGFVFRQG